MFHFMKTFGIGYNWFLFKRKSAKIVNFWGQVHEKVYKHGMSTHGKKKEKHTSKLLCNIAFCSYKETIVHTILKF